MLGEGHLNTKKSTTLWHILPSPSKSAHNPRSTIFFWIFAAWFTSEWTAWKCLPFAHFSEFFSASARRVERKREEGHSEATAQGGESKRHCQVNAHFHVRIFSDRKKTKIFWPYSLSRSTIYKGQSRRGKKTARRGRPKGENRVKLKGQVYKFYTFPRYCSWLHTASVLSLFNIPSQIVPYCNLSSTKYFFPSFRLKKFWLPKVLSTA